MTIISVINHIQFGSIQCIIIIVFTIPGTGCIIIVIIKHYFVLRLLVFPSHYLFPSNNNYYSLQKYIISMQNYQVRRKGLHNEINFKGGPSQKITFSFTGRKKKLGRNNIKIYFKQKKDNVLFVIIQFSIEIKRHCIYKAMLNLVWLRR